MISLYINAKNNSATNIAIGCTWPSFYTVLLVIEKDGPVQTNYNVLI